MKILIVEDEYNAREGLAGLIEKINPDYTVCGKAADGDEGYQLCLTLKPDLMFVDIELPKLNGLQMIDKIKQCLNSPPHFIILSGYAEFQYAQQAIQYGVEEYLLKPVTRDRLCKILDKMAAVIHMNKEQNGKTEFDKNQLLRNVLLGMKNDSAQALDLIKQSVIAENLYIINIYYGENSKIAGLQNSARSFCGVNSLKDSYFSAIEEYRFETILVNTHFSQADLIKKINYVLCYTLRQLGLSDFTVCLLQVKSIDELPKMLNEIVKLNAWALTLGNDTVLYPERTAQIKASDDKKVERFDMQALSALKSENFDALLKVRNAFFDYLYTNQLSPEQIKRMCTSFAFSILAFYKEFNMGLYEKVQSDGLLDRIKNSCTRKELNDCIADLINSYKTAGQIHQNVNSILIRKIVHYIADTYIEKVSLEDIAAQMNVSSEYLSHLFTKEVGISFSEYLKNYRITVAKKLMSSCNYKIYEIGEKIGYRDPKYFCKVFKEVTGYSPKEYMSR